jgi:hypothetical protein
MDEPSADSPLLSRVPSIAVAREAASGGLSPAATLCCSGVLELRHVRPLVGEQEYLDRNVLVDIGL